MRRRTPGSAAMREDPAASGDRARRHRRRRAADLSRPGDQREHLPQQIGAGIFAALEPGPHRAHWLGTDAEILEVVPGAVIVHPLAQRSAEPVAERHAEPHLRTIDELPRYPLVEQLPQ